MHEVLPVVIWRLRRSPHMVACVVEQIGEECFELRLYDGKKLLLSESFEEASPLYVRAEQLRRDVIERRIA